MHGSALPCAMEIPASFESKFARYRAKKKAEGKRLVRLWVPDLSASGMQEEIARQVAVLRNAPEETEVMEWLEAIQAEDGWPE